MIDALGLLLGASALVFSCIGRISSESLVVWKLSIVATEYGQWLALVCPTLLLLPWTFGYRLRWRVLSSILFIGASVFFLVPTWQMRAGLPGWGEDLEKHFGAAEVVRPSWLTVWSRSSSPIAASSLHEFAEGLTLRAYTAKPDAPWVVIVHGGGWNSGDAEQLPELNSALVAEGIAVFSVNYRLAPQSIWPAQRDDVGHAVNYIKSHAKDFQIDPERWAILGRSAGGQIAECVGYALKDPALKGVIAFYAPTDMHFAYRYGREDDILNSRALVRDYLGGDPEHAKANYFSASPLDIASASAPPTLLFHGPRDPLVWVRHSERLDRHLREIGANSLLIELPWVTHGFDYNLFGPGGRVSTYAVLYFLRRVFA